MQRRLAPFVSPVVQGRVMRKQGYQTLSFRPAYTKPKHVVDPNRQFSRLAGEALGGALTPAQRWNAAVAENLREERDAINRLWNWMARNGDDLRSKSRWRARTIRRKSSTSAATRR
jgi:hypothetical protein